MPTAQAGTCPATYIDFYRLSLKPVAGCNPPPAISIYYDYFTFATSGVESQHYPPSETICKCLCIVFPTRGGEGLYKQFAVNIQSSGLGR